MTYVPVIGFCLKAGHLLLLLCCWILSEIPMSWSGNGGVMEKKISFLGDCGKIWLKWWETISGSSWKNHRYYYQYIGSKKVRKTWWRKLLVSWVLGWIMVSLWIFWHLSAQATEKRKETLASMCDERARMLQDQFNVSMNHIQALSIMISTFHHAKTPSAIDQATFARYTERTSFERPLTSGVAYAVRVLHSERKRFEKKHGWTIKRMDTLEQTPVQKDDYDPETLEPSPSQEEYAPVIFACNRNHQYKQPEPTYKGHIPTNITLPAQPLSHLIQMLPVAHAASLSPKVLPVVLAVGSATVAGGYVRSQSRSFGSFAQSNNTVQNEPVQKPFLENCAPEARSPFFNLVLDSIFA